LIRCARNLDDKTKEVHGLEENKKMPSQKRNEALGLDEEFYTFRDENDNNSKKRKQRKQHNLHDESKANLNHELNQKKILSDNYKKTKKKFKKQKHVSAKAKYT
jgi:hypothetical protein